MSRQRSAVSRQPSAVSRQRAGTGDPGGRIAIRPARADDLPGVQRLLTEAGLPTEGLADQFPAGYAVVELAAGLVGAAGIETYGAAGLLRSVVVAPALRGTGLGKALVAERLAWARGHGLEVAYLLTTTAADFFAGLGFERLPREAAPPPIKASREYATVCPGTSVLMRRGV